MLDDTSPFATLRTMIAGDTVAFTTPRGRTSKRVISRTTPTLIMIGEGSYEQTFRRMDGGEVGKPRYNDSTIRPWTADDDDRVARVALAKRIDGRGLLLAKAVDRLGWNASERTILAEDVEKATKAMQLITEALMLLDPEMELV